MHFSQTSDKFVQETQLLQICYNFEHFLQASDNIFAKDAFFFRKKSKNFKNHPATTATVAVYNAQTVSGSQQKGPNC